MDFDGERNTLNAAHDRRHLDGSSGMLQPPFSSFFRSSEIINRTWSRDDGCASATLSTYRERVNDDWRGAASIGAVERGMEVDSAQWRARARTHGGRAAHVGG